MSSKSDRTSRRSRTAAQAEFEFRSNGGARPGSGRKRSGPRPLVPHRKRARISSHAPTLVTIRLIPGLASLRRHAEHMVVRSALRAASTSGAFSVVQYSIQTNHVHLIVEARDRHALSVGMKGLLVRIARALNRAWRRRGSIFADRYHARALRTPREVRNALVYVLHNARKHGIAYRGADDCSSGPWFDGWDMGSSTIRSSLQGAQAAARVDPKPLPNGLSSPRDCADAGPGLARARTWLLSAGWKRWGLIGLSERPAAPEVGRSSRVRGR